MRKYLLAALAMLATAACNNGFKLDTYMDEMALPAAEGSRDSLFMSISLEYVKAGPAADEINAVIQSRAFDLYETSASLEETAVRYRENLIDEYLTENGSGRSSTWEDILEGVFTGDYKGWKNYLLTYYSYKGGAHGIQTACPIVFSAKSGAPVSEEDLFVPGYKEPLAKLLGEALSKDMHEDDDELIGLVEMDQVAPNGNFSVGTDGIQWIFQPYEVGPYALGILSATLSWKQLKPYLK